MTSSPHLVMSIDVEDYFQVAAFFDQVSESAWGGFESRVVQNTRTVMDLLSEADVRATFFVLGWVAEREPELVREIQRRGHEIACHGFSHRFVYDQTPQEFAEETRRSKALLEDISGTEVRGYRAASYSITQRSIWALDTLIEAGFTYDSSIFPIRHDHYGMPGAPEMPHLARTRTGSILEFPLTTARVAGLTLPVAGGGYFRLYPYRLTRFFVRRHQQRRPDPFIFYLHPWEIDPDQPRIEGASLRSRLRHYLNLDRCAARLRRLVSDFPFTTMGAYEQELRSDPAIREHDYAGS